MTCRPGAWARLRITIGSVDQADRRVVVRWLVKIRALGRLVAVHRRVPVEVVGREVEPHRGLGAERRRPRQPEARALDDEGVEILVDRVDERGRVFPASTVRSPAARRISTVSSVVVVLPSVPVIAEDRPRPAGALLLPAVGEFDLRREFDAVPTSGDRSRRASRGLPVQGDTRSHDATRRSRGPVRVGSSSTPSRRRVRACVGRARRRRRSRRASLAQRTHGRRAGDGETVDEYRHSDPPATFVKSPMKMPSADGDADRRDQPEADDHGRLRPADQLEVVMDRRHAEQATRAARRLEHAHLDGDRAGLDHVDAHRSGRAAGSVLSVSAQNASAAPSASAPTSPMKIRAGAAFHHRKPRQPPAKAGGEHAHVERVDDRAVDVGVAERPVGDDRERAEAHQRRSGGQAVETVGHVDRVRGGPDDHPGPEDPHDRRHLEADRRHG